MKLLLTTICALLCLVCAVSAYDNSKDYLDSKICAHLTGSKLYDCYNAECKKRGAHERHGCAICQPDCEQPEGPRVCPLSCPLGCICETGFVRNNVGACVTKSQCGK
ncbi:chymotrypsin inhibitor-like [Chrysoperla carnea]|uniref:chymotrypsin inhibitor-like n=1 Tax=Chrysoperla carnea TaxID=189513 RepID=UPI001D05E6ED|nr:chymotrypsin inhibitor-like [Chrysoperla carnea]